MIQHAPIATLSVRRLVTIDLIGDLDAELGEALAQTLDALTCQGECEVLVNFKRVVGTDATGLAGAAHAIAQKRLAGWPISASVSRRDRRVRSLLSSSRIPFDELPGSLPKARHIMIARHAT
jgi:ABC-type transporter Mla MlaB component